MRQNGAIAMPWVEAAAVKYGWIWIGLTFGLFAKYALLIKKGVKIRGWLIVADIMLLPMVALIAYYLCKQAGIEGESASLLTAAATVGADRLVKLYTDKFVRGVDAMMLDEVNRRKGLIRQEVQVELSADRALSDIATGKRPLGGE